MNHADLVRYDLVLECPWPVEVGEQIQLTARFSRSLVFFPARFVIQDASDWIVHDLKIVHTSQLTRADVSGEQLHDALRGGRCSTVRCSDEVLMCVSRQHPGTLPFRCEIRGWRDRREGDAV